MISEKTIYAMSLGAVEYSYDGNTKIVRVPGGWIWIFYLDSERAVSEYVPFNNEFQKESHAS
jgi:hypothetical protein